MEWLTRELTPIEKVRRNVILLATLAALCSFFPIQTDQITFLGARFTSDVVAFGLFHALMFYVSVLSVRAYFHERIIRDAANADAFEHQSRISMAQNTLRAANEIIDLDDRREIFDPVSQTYKQVPEAEYTPHGQRLEA